MQLVQNHLNYGVSTGNNEPYCSPDIPGGSGWPPPQMGEGGCTGTHTLYRYMPKNIRKVQTKTNMATRRETTRMGSTTTRYAHCELTGGEMCRCKCQKQSRSQRTLCMLTSTRRDPSLRCKTHWAQPVRLYFRYSYNNRNTLLYGLLGPQTDTHDLHSR